MLRIMGTLICGAGMMFLAADTLGDQAKDDVKDINGLWILEAREENGKQHPPGDDGLYLENKTVLWTNKAGTVRYGQTANMTLDPSKEPKAIDFLITRGSYNGKTQLGIYKVEGDKLTIALNNVGNEARPGKFTTGLNAGAARAADVLTYTRVKPRKVSDAEKKPGNKDDVKDINGLWALEAREENGKQHPPGDDGLYFENKTVLWTNKTGKNRSGPTANVAMDPSKGPPTMNFLMTRGSANGHTQLAVYRLEGDKLIIAFANVDDDIRPQQFTTSLTAGVERALEVRTYVRVKAPN